MTYQKISGQQYSRESVQLLRDYAPDIRACKKCGHPVLDGYCCSFCGTSTPESEDDDA